MEGSVEIVCDHVFPFHRYEAYKQMGPYMERVG